MGLGICRGWNDQGISLLGVSIPHSPFLDTDTFLAILLCCGSTPTPVVQSSVAILPWPSTANFWDHGGRATSPCERRHPHEQSACAPPAYAVGCHHTHHELPGPAVFGVLYVSNLHLLRRPMCSSSEWPVRREGRCTQTVARLPLVSRASYNTFVVPPCRFAFLTR